MALNNYYKEELISLRTEGAEFSRTNPGLSTYLAQEGQDPDVERLLEGFSFLTGKLKQQMDQELPEVAHSLVQLLWPNYIRPIPSYSIIQYESLKDSVENVKVPKNTQVLSKINSGVVQCKFSTNYDINIMPIDIKSVDYFKSGRKSLLELNFEMTASGNLSDLIFDDFKIHLSGSKFIAQDLYLFMTNYIEEIEIIVNDKDKKALGAIFLNSKSIEAVGFDTKDSIIPYPSNVFDGYILLQEFFCFKEKYFFVNVKNLEKIQNISKDILSQSNNFTMKIKFKKSLHSNAIPEISNFLLHCTPIVNLFEADSVPIRKKNTEDEFLVLASDSKPMYSEIFAISSVRGWVKNKNNYQDYLPFEAFEHTNDGNEYYSSRIKLSSDGQRTNTYLRFSNSANEVNDLLNSDSIVSVKLLASNKNAPSSLGIGDICMSNTTNLKFKNINIPSISYPPPIAGDFLWRIISNMSLNYLSLNNIKTLRTIVETYDFFGAYDIKQKEKTEVILSGIEEISYKRDEFIDKGLPIRGTKIHLKINPLKFSCIGEAYLFSSVLNEFFALYGNINSFHKLSVDIKNEDSFEWPYRIGNEVLA